jgi:mannosylglycerate hydrolase
VHAPSHESRTDVQAPLRVYVVSHTHWDREWYHSAGRFRQQLVALLDAVLAREHAEESFLLDGQAITLLDYLAVRPERESALRARLQSGALEAGPWFVLADNLIPSGEAILRNLEAGHRVLRRFGAAVPPVAYCPDSFGHPAALPAIAAGYGFPVAIVWRGAGGATHPAVDAFRWHAADGSSVVVHHLPPDGYEYGSALPIDVDAAGARWRRMQPALAGRNHTGIVLLLNGADHHALQPDIHDAVEALREAAAPAAIVERASLTTFATHFAAAGRTAALPNVRGELRDSYGYSWTLGGTLGTRAHQKRRNARLERALLRDVEPWLALSWLQHVPARSRATSDNGTLTLAQLPALLNTTWQQLLETHPHDTLCGCSIDAVGRDMEVRQQSVQAQVTGLRAAALQLALQHDVVAARSRAVQPASDHAVVVRNRAATARGGVVELRLIETLGDVPVGPGSGDVPPVTRPDNRPVLRLAGALLQPLDARIVHRRRESPQHYPDNDLVRVHRVVAWIPEVPAFGLRVFDAAASMDVGDPPPVRTIVSASGLVLDNGRIVVTIHEGQVAIEQHGRRIADALRLESTADLGDSYTPSLRGDAERLVCVDVRVRQGGPWRGAIRLRWESAMRDIRVQTTLVLDADADVLRCDVRGVNRRRNHRLQLVWHTGLARAVTMADAAFGPVARHLPSAPVNTHGAPREAVVPTMPMHRWAMQSDGGHAVTVFADGLAEAESTPGALAVTLVRAIGALSVAHLPERPGHAGWPSPIPAAQCLGPFAARVGIMLHADGPDVMQRNSRAADALLLPLTGETWRDLEVARTPSSLSGPQLVGAGLEASAVTMAQRSDGVILRAVNLTADTVSGQWILPHEGPWVITPCRLDETPCGAARPCGAQVDFVAQPREIVTVHVAAAS